MMLQMLLIFCLFLTVTFATPDVSHLLHDNHNHHHASSSNGYTYERPTDFVTDNQNVRTSYISPASGTHITTSDEYKQHQQYDVGGRSSGGINYVQQPSIFIKYSPVTYAQNYNNAGATTSNLRNERYGATRGQIQNENVSSLRDDQYRYDGTGEQIQQDTFTIRPIYATDFYYHTAPQDQIIDYGTKYVNVGHPQRSQKVIFIKPPSYHGKAHIVPILPRNDEKTFVYVLNKQPTFETTVDAQQQPSVPTKPDVVFLKYKSAEEARRAEEKIRNAFESGHVPSGGAGDDAAPGLGGLFSTAVNTLTSAGTAVQSAASNFVSGASGFTNIFGGRYGEQYGDRYTSERNQQHIITSNHGQNDFQVYPSTNYEFTNPSVKYATIGSLANNEQTIPSVSFITTNPSTVSHVTQINDEYLPPGKK